MCVRQCVRLSKSRHQKFGSFFPWDFNTRDGWEGSWKRGDIHRLTTSIGSPLKKQESSRKTSTSTLLTMPTPLTEWITTNYGKYFKWWEYQTTWPASWEICMQVRKQQLELDMGQQTGSVLGNEYVKAVYCHPAYLTYLQSTSCEMPG